uniref:Single-stranded DNA-binding protein n=1 Tax=Escherichia coli TaxID=562 RepID=A0A2Z5VJZ2_ECOLX|nr:single-stranded DNA-binding protein [Escherichia coli]
MMGAENINRRRHIMAVRGINKVILVGRLGKAAFLTRQETAKGE